MRAFPFGVPKLMVSTLASGQVRPYVGVRDILMMHSVVDICGLNRISRTVLTNAANAMIGMVKAPAQAVRRGGVGRRQTADRRHHVRRHHALRRGGAQTSGSGRLRSAGLSRHRHRRHDDGIVHPRRPDRRRARSDDDGVGRRAGRRHSHGGTRSADGGGAARRAAGHLAGRARHGQLRAARDGAGEVSLAAVSISTIPT